MKITHSELKISTLRLHLTSLLHPEIFKEEKKYIFVISHMRCFSTLLCHILGSNDQISGYSEMLHPYDGNSDLMRLRYWTYLTQGRQNKGNFVLDKILHNEFTVPEAFLKDQNFRFVFLLRKPEETFSSIRRMVKNDRGVFNGWYDNQQLVLDYYTNRLAEMENECRQTNGNSVFIPSERLIENSESVLKSLGDWLDIEDPLKTTYQMFRYSGLPCFGDPSFRNKKMKIDTHHMVNTTDHCASPEITAIAEKNYTRCYDTLSSNCTCIN